MEPEDVLLDTFVELADTLVNDFDVTDLLYTLCHRCHELLEVDAVGVLLATYRGQLLLSAASTEVMEELELFQMQREEGPCVDAFRAGEQVVELDMGAVPDRWPSFVPRARALGFRSVFAFPLRLRGERIGALNMFRRSQRPFEQRDMRVAQAIADVATIGILQERAVRDAETLAGQLQQALDSRVVIEQAKGVVATRLGISVREAFEHLRRESRTSGRTLRDVCQEAVDGTLRLEPPSGP